jgi:L-threonylcarbamoyladenylate synthase
MEIINKVTQAEIEKAANALRGGHLVAFPTETVYGLGADATNEKAVSKIYSVKGRPKYHPLIVHISSINSVDKWAVNIPDYAFKLAQTFWPGPMTLILRKSQEAKDFVTGGQNTIGLRIPNNQIALKLLVEFEKLGGSGVAAPSANRFGAISPTTAPSVAEELEKFLGKEDLILDGGQCLIGVESSIINCTQENPALLRPGAINEEMIQEVMGIKVFSAHSNKEIRVSGSLKSHYSPKARVVLGKDAKLGEGFIALSHIPTPIGAIRLASPRSIDEYASTLYEALRSGDRIGLSKICVWEPAGNGLAIAIRDRLAKAASGN